MKDDITKKISDLRQEQVSGINERIADVFADEQRSNFERNQAQEQAVKDRVYQDAPPPESGRKP
jgi:hypothetical protein